MKDIYINLQRLFWLNELMYFDQQPFLSNLGFSILKTKWENLVWKIFELAKLWEESNSLSVESDRFNIQRFLKLRKEQNITKRRNDSVLASKKRKWEPQFISFLMSSTKCTKADNSKNWNTRSCAALRAADLH